MKKGKINRLKNQIQKAIKSKNYPLVSLLMEKYRFNVGEINEKKS
tara:strand:- start:349 stop:483 length:135 start_codon:yes stop_codon:yes gene_type:complete